MAKDAVSFEVDRNGTPADHADDTDVLPKKRQDVSPKKRICLSNPFNPGHPRENYSIILRALYACAEASA